MKRLLIGIVLVVAAAFIAVAFKDYLDQKNPEYAVPHLTVTADTTEVQKQLASYFWTFTFGKEAEMQDPILERMDYADGMTGWEEGLIPTTELSGGERLEFSFSQRQTDRHIDRTGNYDYRFNPADDEPFVPYERGMYIYRVTAEFERGQVTYYFRVNVV